MVRGALQCLSRKIGQRSALHPHGLKNAVRLALRHCSIKAIEIQLVPPHGRRQREQTVPGDLVRIGVACPFHLVHADREPRDHGQNHTRCHQLGALDARDLDVVHVSNGAPQEPDNETSHHCDGRQDGWNRIGLPDVADHLLRVEQVVDRDEVEPC